MTNLRHVLDARKKFDKGFLYLIWDELNPLWGLPLGIAGFLVALFPEFTKDNNITILIIICSLIACATLFNTAFEAYKENEYLRNKGIALPRIVEGRKSYRKSEGEKALCILEPSEFFIIGALCSIYYCHENFEEPIGFGEVININIEGGFIQVEITGALGGNEDKIDSIMQNNQKCLERLRIKPSIPMDYLNQIR